MASVMSLIVDRQEGADMGALLDGATRKQVGQVHKISSETEPEEWKAWLWKVAGHYPTEHGGSCEAVQRKGPLVELTRNLHRRGKWWVDDNRVAHQSKG